MAIVAKLAFDVQAFVAKRQRRRIVALIVGHQTQVMQHVGDTHLVAQRPLDGEALLVHGLGDGEFAFVERDIAQALQRIRDPRSVA